jgi:hypothetical protein
MSERVKLAREIASRTEPCFIDTIFLTVLVFTLLASFDTAKRGLAVSRQCFFVTPLALI